MGFQIIDNLYKTTTSILVFRFSIILKYDAGIIPLKMYICGVAQNTRRSGRAVATVLLSFYGCFRQFWVGALRMWHV